ncbi:hypothetical protein EV363DRAFT_288600 [Boletus edulis]|nr:hypothetical protein EV363DRAFT_288600 [Boletus edulis]
MSSLIYNLFCFLLPANCASDAALVCLSLKLLWRVKLPQGRHRMVLSLFSSSVLMSMSSLFHAICQLVVPLESAQYIAFDTEVFLSLIVCNLLIIS